MTVGVCVDILDIVVIYVPVYVPRTLAHLLQPAPPAFAAVFVRADAWQIVVDLAHRTAGERMGVSKTLETVLVSGVQLRVGTLETKMTVGTLAVVGLIQLPGEPVRHRVVRVVKPTTVDPREAVTTGLVAIPMPGEPGASVLVLR